MADVMSAFLQGHQFAQAESQHQQQLEENKLRTQVLKHEIDRMKIDDQVRARELAKSNFDLLHGQPEADLPATTTTTPQPDALPSRNLAGVVQGLIQGGQGRGVDSGTPAPVTSSTPPSMPSTIAAPRAQSDVLAQPPVTTRTINPVQIPGVDAFGGAPATPGVSLRPRSLEDVIHAQIAAEMAKPYTLKDDEKRMLGNQVIAKGGGKKVIVPPGGTLVDEDNPSQPLATGGPGNSEFAQFQQIYAEGFGAKAFKDLTAPQKAGAIPAFTKMKQDPTLAAMRADAAEMRRAAAEARAEQTQHTNDFRQYSGEVAQAQRKHAEAFTAWRLKNATALPGEETDPPEYTPPSFDEWQADREAKQATAKPAAAGKPAAATGAAKEGDVKPIPGYPGTEMIFKGGKWIRTK